MDGWIDKPGAEEHRKFIQHYKTLWRKEHRVIHIGTLQNACSMLHASFLHAISDQEFHYVTMCQCPSVLPSQLLNFHCPHATMILFPNLPMCQIPRGSIRGLNLPVAQSSNVPTSQSANVSMSQCLSPNLQAPQCPSFFNFPAFQSPSLPEM